MVKQKPTDKNLMDYYWFDLDWEFFLSFFF